MVVFHSYIMYHGNLLEDGNLLSAVPFFIHNADFQVLECTIITSLWNKLVAACQNMVRNIVHSDCLLTKTRKALFVHFASSRTLASL